MSAAWVRQCSFPSGGFTSTRKGIWHDVRVTRDSKITVKDRDMARGRVADCSGNLVPKKAGPARRWMVAKVQVERLIDSLCPAERALITNASKWALVEKLANRL